MPIRSAGCATCRKRKIRCDETRPKCRRCATHGVACPGYRTPAPGEVEFRDQTEWIVQRAKDTYRCKGTTGTGLKGSATSSVSPGSDGGSNGLASMDSFTDAELAELTGNSENRLVVPRMEFLEKNETTLDFSRAMAIYAMPQFLPSPALEKALIYSTFMDTYLPKRIGNLDSHFSFLQHLITTPNLRPEVAQGLDALSMVQVGSIYNDKDLLKQSVKAYIKSLSGLLKTLSSANVVQDDYVLATVTILASCEFFSEIAQVGDGWSKHILGSQQLLAARGPDGLNSQMSLLLYSNMRHGALSHALIARKATFLGTPEWRAVAFRAPLIDSATFCYDIALQVPAVLERFDQLDFANSMLVEDMDGILADAKKLEAELRDWYADFQVRSKLARQATHTLVSIDEFPTFTKLVSDRAIDQAYMFQSFMQAYLICVYWDVMHFLRTAIQKLHMARHEEIKDWYPDSDETVTEEELMQYVMDMCRVFPFFCEPVSSSSGHIGIFLPMRTAAIHFKEHGNWSMLKWIGAVKDNVFTRGMRPPSVRGNFDRQPGASPKSYS